MKRVYLLAFQRATNYGAVLQLFALKKVIEKYDMEVRVVDYVPPWMKVTLKNQPSILSFLKRRIMNFTFKKIFNSLSFTNSSFYQNDALKKELTDGDFYFVGSDQVWNRSIMHNDPTYFLDFVPKNARRIGYAISMGNTHLEEPFKSEAFTLMREFDMISAREIFVKDYINSRLSDISVPIVLDPTLLLDYEDYQEVLEKRSFGEDYIAVYSAMHDQNLYDLANFLKKITGFKLVNLGYHFKGCDRHEYVFGPGNWLNRIKKSKYFITNSFHGSVFAILGKSKFFVVPNQDKRAEGLNARFMELLESLDLMNQVVYSESDLEEKLDQEICYEKAFGLLSKRRENSIAFIEEALSL